MSTTIKLALSFVRGRKLAIRFKVAAKLSHTRSRNLVRYCQLADSS